MYLANIDDYSIFINEVNMYKNNQGLAEHVTVNKTTLNCQMKNSDCGMSTHIILVWNSHGGVRLTPWVHVSYDHWHTLT